MTIVVRPIGDALQACDGLFEAVMGALASRELKQYPSTGAPGRAGGSTSFDRDEPEILDATGSGTTVGLK